MVIIIFRKVHCGITSVTSSSVSICSFPFSSELFSVKFYDLRDTITYLKMLRKKLGSGSSKNASKNEKIT